MITKLDKKQWVSVVENALLAGLVPGLLSLQASVTLDSKAGFTALTIAGMAFVKVIQKAFTPVV